MRYFFYGSLRDPEVLALVLGRAIAPRALKPAELQGFRTLRVAGASYPLIEPCAGSGVEGVVAEGLSPADAARLAQYEGPDYSRRAMTVRLAGGRAVAALVFRPRPSLRTDGTPWRFDDWCRDEKARFLAALRAEFADATRSPVSRRPAARDRSPGSPAPSAASTRPGRTRGSPRGPGRSGPPG